MKLVLALPFPLLISVAMIPVVLGGGDSAPFTGCGLYGGEIDTILRTIRTLESGDDYRAEAAGSTASGAYQFIDSTWDGYGGYQRASSAPPEVQDAKAAEMVRGTLGEHEGNVSAVPVVWYVGGVPAAGSSRWDEVPVPDAGNVLTPRQYQARWIDKYQDLLGDDDGGIDSHEADPLEAGGCIGGSIEALAGGWSLPGPRSVIDANPSALDDPHHDYPAWDWILPENTPVYAVRGGTVVSTQYWPFNWWDEGCGLNGRSDCRTCGIGVTIASEDGTRWTYCHGTNLTIADNAVVEAGQQIMWSGNTGRSGTAHLHLEIRTSGVRRCPQPLLVSMYRDETGAIPASLPLAGCSFET
ncbi:M23 family metallopeptidase [Ilumatobacter nonamiensis]|uniref:M23 family metallopeptidase n=1 Tax=Ilumatobacter nonamiensis TaxID=467093 RepID=UPI00034AAC2E|nr:peptidoglycan DD-metalloendopeptidase family protein [Ilumatobacter nonamiensis]